MSRQSLSQFVAAHAEQDRSQGLFELESDRVLEVNLNGLIWMKMGAMIILAANRVSEDAADYDDALIEHDTLASAYASV